MPQMMCKKLTLEADYRMPRMYPLMVATAVNVTLIVDGFVLGTEVGGAPIAATAAACELHAAVRCRRVAAIT